MAGTISLSLSQQFDELGDVLARGRLYFYQAGTTSTPQNAYYDSGLTLPFPNPYTLDDAGRIPQFFLADGQIKVVLIDRNGVTQINADNVLVIGPSGGGGGGGTVDPTTVWQTGDLKPRYSTGAHTGFVRANGRTIGSSTSGATELANPSAQALFLHLYAEDPNLAVSGGRGASAAADWAANKTIALPDWRGRNIAGMDDMGAPAASRLTSTYWGGSGITLGSVGGNEKHTLTVPELPAAPPFSGDTSSTLNISHPMAGNVDGGTSNPASFRFGNNTTAGTTFVIEPEGEITVTGNLGLSQPHSVVAPSMVTTIYIKL